MPARALLQRATLVPPPYQWKSVEALAAYNRDPTLAPNDLRKWSVDTLVATLVAAGVWAKLDVFQIYAALSDSASTMNWKSASYVAAVDAGAPVRFGDRGWFTDGVDDLLRTGFAPNAGSNYTQNSAFIATWCRSREQQSSPFGSQIVASIDALVNPRNTSDKLAARCNSTTGATSTTSITNAWGLSGVNREDASNLTLWKNGVQVDGNFASTSAAPSSQQFRFGRSNSTFMANQAVLFAAGAKLTSSEWLAFYNAVALYITALGISEIGTTSGSGVATTAALIDQKAAPDGTEPDQPGFGFPTTGWGQSPQFGFRWAGWGIGGQDARAGIYRCGAPTTTNATITILNQYRTTDLFPGIADLATSSTQGVFVDPAGTDGSHDVWWVASKASPASSYLCRAHWNGSTLSAISATALPGNYNAACKDKRGDWWVVDGTTVIRKATVDGSGLLALASPAISLTIPGGNVDQITSDWLLDLLLVSGGPNGSDGYIVSVPPIGDYGRPYIRQVVTVAAGLGIEGCVSKLVYNGNASGAGVLETMNDQKTHTELSFQYNGLHLNGQVTLYAA